VKGAKNCRIYDESAVNPVQVFYSELEVYFNQCINDGYNIYVLNNKSKYNIILNDNDIDYINLKLLNYLNESENYYFSENLKYIKENQYKDYK
jgi:hypothetical protein